MTDFTIKDIPRGDNVVLDITLHRIVAGTETLDLTEVGTQVWFTAKLDKLYPDSNALFQKTVGSGITIVGSNSLLVTLAPGDTENLSRDVERLFYDLQIKEGLTGQVSTPINDELYFRADVTRTRV